MRQQSLDNTSGETYFYFLKQYRNWQEYRYFLKWSNLGHFALPGPRKKYLAIEVQANFQKSVHWAIIQVSLIFFFQTLVLSLNHHKSFFFK